MIRELIAYAGFIVNMLLYMIITFFICLFAVLIPALIVHYIILIVKKIKGKGAR